MTALDRFIKVTGDIGRNQAYVQGGGGNTSYKLDDRQMLVKASGIRMDSVGPFVGHCTVDFEKIRTIIAQQASHPIDADAFSKAVTDCTLSGAGRPSMETGFHALLGPFVIHTHSIYANALTCAEEGESCVKTLFPEALWVPYTTPGLAVTLQIQSQIQNDTPSVLFLQNHGIIVSGQSPESAFELHEEINDVLKTQLKLTAGFTLGATTGDLHWLEHHILFPDQVIYTMSGKKLEKTQAAAEVISAYWAILDTMKTNNLTPHFLSENHATELLNLDSEKFRQQSVEK